MKQISVSHFEMTTLGSATDAIVQAKTAEGQFRTIQDSQVRGLKVVDFGWSDNSLELALSNGKVLRISSCAGIVSANVVKTDGCELACEDGLVCLNFTDSEIEWNRYEFLIRLKGDEIEGLWFSKDFIIIYASTIALRCSALAKVPNEGDLLFWYETT